MVSPTKNGRIHDKRLFDKELWRHWIPPDVSVWMDTGFIGVGPIGDEVFMPKKKSKNHPLTTAEKQTNQAISSIRVVVEHAIGGIKRFAATTNVYRNKK